MITLETTEGNALVLSQNAYNSLNHKQLQKLENYCSLIIVDVNTIETVGGGSVRCMIAEIFAEKIIT
jgi:hypothetical protein